MSTPDKPPEAGARRHYVVVEPLFVGGIGRALAAGEVVVYDGHTLEIDGARFASPLMRHAIDLGWLVRSLPPRTDRAGEEAPPWAG